MEQTEQHTIWQSYIEHKTPELRMQIIERYRDLVKSVVARYLVPFRRDDLILTEDDLKQIAMMGLLEAIDRFDPNRGFKFETYALSRIQGAIQDELRKIDWMPRATRKRYRENITNDSYGEMYEQNISFDNCNNKRQSVDELFADESSDFRKDLPQEELTNALAGIIQGLEERERIVISLYYYEELTMKEIGAILSLSESRVSQIHADVLEKIRKELKILQLYE